MIWTRVNEQQTIGKILFINEQSNALLKQDKDKKIIRSQNALEIGKDVAQDNHNIYSRQKRVGIFWDHLRAVGTNIFIFWEEITEGDIGLSYFLLLE